MLQFHLAPIESIEPWGTPDKPSLSWFGLTLGWMVWPVGTQELFRYRKGLDRELGWDPEENVPAGFEDSVTYQLARPLQDIGECLVHWLEPVPEDVLERIGGGSGLDAVLGRYEQLMDAEASDDDIDAAEPAMRFAGDRCLDSGHLMAGPPVQVIREGSRVRILCDNRDRTIEGVRAWAAERVDETLALDEFTASMRAFGDRLFEQMDERIGRVEAGLRHPGVELEAAALCEQHRTEMQSWSRALERAGDTDWNAVRAGLAILGL